MRGRRIAGALAVVFGLAGVGLIGGQPAAATASGGSIGVDADQGGRAWYQDQTALTPQLVQGGSFGQLYSEAS